MTNLFKTLPDPPALKLKEDLSEMEWIFEDETKPMTPERQTEIKALTEASTGPLVLLRNEQKQYLLAAPDGTTVLFSFLGEGEDIGTLRFHAVARGLVLELLAAIKELQPVPGMTAIGLEDLPDARGAEQ